jgi:glycosyltransferase involved in cell wall biosynthesis
MADVISTDPVAALDQRLGTVAPLLEGVRLPDGQPGPGAVAAHLLPQLVRSCQGSSSLAPLWLVLTALGGALPSEDEIRAAARTLELSEGSQAELRLLDIAFDIAARADEPLTLEVTSDSVVVDVDFCARHDIHTGIQRVVRETVPRWAAEHEVVPVAWTDDYTAYRSLRPSEVANVFSYAHRSGTVRSSDVQHGPATLMVPWNSVIAIPEIPEPSASPFLAALAQYSGNRLVAVGYDMIPIVSADLRPGPEATRFTQYLNVVKHAAHVAGISRSSTAEFSGFSQALGAQGLQGPSVTEVLLPTAVPIATDPVEQAAPDGPPQVLCIGTHDPHKNHLTLVHAAERLWREGLDFELVFVGGRGWRAATDGTCFDAAVAAGRPVRDLGRVSDAELASAIRSAAFSVFISLHEGYGLPVAESLASGTPVVTTGYGSLLEIAEHGGCLVVDPRDDDDVTSAIRRLLTEPELLARLRQEAVARPVRSWDDYADELWDILVEEARS